MTWIQALAEAVLERRPHSIFDHPLVPGQHFTVTYDNVPAPRPTLPLPTLRWVPLPQRRSRRGAK